MIEQRHHSVGLGGWQRENQVREAQVHDAAGGVLLAGRGKQPEREALEFATGAIGGLTQGLEALDQLLGLAIDRHPTVAISHRALGESSPTLAGLGTKFLNETTPTDPTIATAPIATHPVMADHLGERRRPPRQCVDRAMPIQGELPSMPPRSTPECSVPTRSESRSQRSMRYFPG